MLSLIATNTHFPNLRYYPLPRLNGFIFPSLVIDCNPRGRGRNYEKSVALLGRNFGFTEVRRSERNFAITWSCWCVQGEEGEGDVELEAEIMNFMAKSEKPTMFPTKRELMRGGRMDLVEDIERKGGWYSLGWDDESVVDNVEEAMGVDIDVDIGEFQRRVESCKESASLREHSGDSFPGDGYGDGFSSELNSNSGDLVPLRLTTSSPLGRSLEIGAVEDSGIEGILSRLEKQRNNDFGLDLGKNGYPAYASSKDDENDRHFDTSFGIARIDHEENGRLTPGLHRKGILNTSGGKISRNNEPATWRTWSNQRAGIQHTEFEAAEISFSKDQLETDKESYHDGILVNTEEYAEDWYKYEQINPYQIRTRLQHLESELSTALESLRSKSEERISDEVTGNSSDLRKLSDAWEFQENEFMSAKARLRSIRAQLAILEGKMALAIIDAQKMVGAKQKRIDGARKALQLLRTICIVWPNTASEVLFAGSFDGWTSQRKMEKSRTGIFSLCLKLYPGRYEIKFIVDGVWKVDPLRPIVKNNGYENNLLIVT